MQSGSRPPRNDGRCTTTAACGRPRGLIRHRLTAGHGLLVAACFAVACLATVAQGQSPGGLATPAWPLEVITLNDGRRLEGLVVDGPGQPVQSGMPAEPVGFVQVIRPPGRPMYLIAWSPISPARISMVQRLPPAERQLLARRVADFRDRRGAWHTALTAVKLTRDDEDEPWRYRGPWFALSSTADPQLTREAVVRLEQVFSALESLVPPLQPAAGTRDPLEVRICGTVEEYRGVQARLGVRSDPPALYSPTRRLLVAGSDAPALVEQEKAAADELAAAERRLDDRDRGFEKDVRGLAADLERQGIAAGARGEIVKAARRRWQRERAEIAARIVAARRENAASVEAARREFFARLAHEAWHAYADLRLVRPGGGSLPHWLDEGLAQVIETAPLEAGELRLDAADPLRLRALQQALSGPRPPGVKEALEAGDEQFLSGHGRSGQGGRDDTSREAYLMAWGLAFHLAILEPVLSREAIAGLADAAGRGDAPGRATEFERLVGRPLSEFEPAWRRRLLVARPLDPVIPPAAGR